ncbi:TerB family tellurite resistance protein [Shimia ponticola]|uniref:tellurite resistance TerB family protein n=1 Tax=Shimia ponticola TaxID=2582893 RepID=UPI0011BDA265|nr:TerB family tellurite resistance protein [Shimia ponticola]
MFERLFHLFDPEPYETPLPEADAEHAFGALMVRVAKADHAYLYQELERIDYILAKRNNLSAVDAAKFRAGCEKLEEAMPDTKALSEILAREVPEEGRESMFIALWQVLLADGLKHRSEEKVIDQVAAILGIGANRATALAASVLPGMPNKDGT